MYATVFYQKVVEILMGLKFLAQEADDLTPFCDSF